MMSPLTQVVGREKELELLMAQMSSAISGQGRLVMVSGEAGSGKSSLCAAFIQMAMRSDCLVLTGRCIPGSQSPYLPFMEAFLDELRNPFEQTKEASATSWLPLSVLECVERLSRDKLVILWLEDLHWADSASISLVHFLARNVRTRRVLVLGTYRPEDLHPSASGEAHPLKEALRAMRREGACSELELQLLGPDETREIVTLRLGGEVEEPLLDLVAGESRGNPLFAVELINLLRTSEQAVPVNGVWKLRSRDLQTPSTIKEVVLARTEPLPKQARRMLETASVIGEWFEPSVIEDALGVQRGEVLEALELLDKEYCLVTEADGWYKFTHDKVRQIVYDEVSSLRRRELHRSVGLLLEKSLPNDELLGQLSWHFDKGNDNERCIMYSLSAGRYCYHRKAVREAKIYLLRALNRAEKAGGFLEERLQALETLGDLRSDVSNLTEWYSYYERFLALNKDRIARARVLAKASECLDQAALLDKGKALGYLNEAEALAEGDPEILGLVEFRRADIDHNDCSIDSALMHIARAKQYFERLGNNVGIMRLQVLEVMSLRQAYRLSEAKRLAEELLRSARESGDPEMVVLAGMLCGFTCSMIGDTPLAKMYGTETIELADKLGMMWYWRLALHKRAWAHELNGDVKAAIRDATLAFENALELESPFYASLFELDLGLYKLQNGEVKSAELHHEAASKRMSAFDSWPRSLLESGLFILRAELSAKVGAIEQSDGWYGKAIEHNSQLGHAYEEMNCRLRYGLALVQRGMSQEGNTQFTVAMELAKKMGCEKRAHTFARWAGVDV